MGRFSNRFIPGVSKIFDPLLRRIGWSFKSYDHEAQIYLNGEEIKFKIDDTDNIVTINKSGIVGSLTGGSGLPDQTGNSGKYVTTDGTDASWDEITHSDLGDGGTLTHTQIDSSIGNINSTISGLSTVYAPIAKGVTNGDTHNHNGGDGAQIAYSSLSGIPSTFTPTAHTNTSHSETYITSAGVTYANLSANGSVGTGASQVASGTHTHTGLYEPLGSTRKGSVSLTTGSNTVAFSTPMSNTSYIFLGSPYCYDSSGNTVSFTITERTTTGFDINVPVNCTCEYKVEAL